MAWVIFFLCAVITALVSIPCRQWRHLWPAGLLCLLLILTIDSTLISLGAFTYKYGSPFLFGLPFFYWVSGFFGGSVLVYLLPVVKSRQIPYILAAALVFLLLELIMFRIGYFQYIKWNPLNSYLLNIAGFVILIWLSQIMGAVGKKAY